MSVSITKVLEALANDPLAFYLVDNKGVKHRVFNIESDRRGGMNYTIADAEGLKARVQACVEGCDCGSSHDYAVPQAVYARFENAANREAIERDLAVLAKVGKDFLSDLTFFQPMTPVVLKGQEYESSNGLSMGEVMVVATVTRNENTNIWWAHGYKARGRFIDEVHEELWRLKKYVPYVEPASEDA